MADVPPIPHQAIPNPYIPNTDADRALMLDRLGLTSIDDLFEELPAAHRSPAIDVPIALAEADLVRMLAERASENVTNRPSFLGACA